MSKNEKENKKTHIFFDAIHEVMSLDDSSLHKKIKSIIDCPLFQRLKDIKQLGFSDMVFPTAVHTRFSHGLGAAFLSWRIIKKLDLTNTKEDKETAYNTVLACLVHDIGHGPFSHTFEDFLDECLKIKITHEDWTKIFLEELKDKYVSVLDTTFIESKINPPKEEDRDVYSDIVSSQLDADRLDYLLRDSHFCGVEYGNYDLEWLLSCVDTYQENKNNRLAISYKGLGAVENLLMNRRLMTQNIYYHKLVKAFEHLFKHFLRLLRDEINNSGMNEALVSRPLYSFLKDLYDESKPEDVINEKYHFYKSLCDYDFWHTTRAISNIEGGKVSDELKHLSDCFYYRTPPVMFPVGIDHIAANNHIEEIFPNKKDWEIYLMKLDFQTYKVKNSPPIVFNDEGCQPHYARDVSEIVRKMGGSIEPKYYLLIERSFCADKNNKKAIKDILNEIKCPESLFCKIDSCN